MDSRTIERGSGALGLGDFNVPEKVPAFVEAICIRNDGKVLGVTVNGYPVRSGEDHEYRFNVKINDIIIVTTKDERGLKIVRGFYSNGKFCWETIRDDREYAIEYGAIKKYLADSQIVKKNGVMTFSFKPIKYEGKKRWWLITKNGESLHKKNGRYDLEITPHARYRLELANGKEKIVFISYVDEESKTILLSHCKNHLRIFYYLKKKFKDKKVDMEFVPKGKTKSFDFSIENKRIKKNSLRGVLVEADGAAYHSEPEKIFNDMEKNKLAKGLGYEIIRLRLGQFKGKPLPKIENHDIQVDQYDAQTLYELSETIRELFEKNIKK